MAYSKDLDQRMKRVENELDVVYQRLLEEETATMTGEELHLLLITVREWTNLRFGEKMRAEVVRRYAREAMAKES